MAKVPSMWEGLRVVATGSCEGVATATACPSVTCQAAAFIADGGNTGYVCIGNASTVTLAGNASVTTAGMILGTTTSIGMTPFIPCTNLNNFTYICSSTVDWFTYICIG